jgi:hypothetical protein
LTEQGLGDKIMFGRYIALLRQYFKRIVVQCHESLDCFYNDYEICRTVAESGCDVCIPICSLAKPFGMVSENWLKGKFKKAGVTGERLKIGVVWSGSTTHSNNRNRSCNSRYFSDLHKYGDLYSLNPAASAAKNVTKLRLDSWTATASYVLAMDVSVSVDTSIVHLAGSLGVPTIMVQPLMETDFRWGSGEETAWYQSVSIVPNRNNWDEVFAVVRKKLECL